jgi:tetratricopeptide repeat protein 30
LIRLYAPLCLRASRLQAYRKYDVLTAKHIEALRRHTKAIQDARLGRDNEGIKAALKLYDEALEKWVAATLLQADAAAGRRSGVAGR